MDIIFGFLIGVLVCFGVILTWAWIDDVNDRLKDLEDNVKEIKGE